MASPALGRAGGAGGAPGRRLVLGAGGRMGCHSSRLRVVTFPASEDRAASERARGTDIASEHVSDGGVPRDGRAALVVRQQDCRFGPGPHAQEVRCRIGDAPSASYRAAGRRGEACGCLQQRGGMGSGLLEKRLTRVSPSLSSQRLEHDNRGTQSHSGPQRDPGGGGLGALSTWAKPNPPLRPRHLPACRPAAPRGGA